MFEDLTKEAVQERILSRLPEDDDITPHSPLYIITAPTAYGWEIFYQDQSKALEQVFPDTADRDNLIHHASIYNIQPYAATYSHAEGEFNIEVPIGSRFSKESVNFRVVEFLRNEESKYYYNLECEQTGEVGNVAPGKILPIEFIDGLTLSNITRILVPGEEEEDTETFRERFLASFNNKAFCANLSDYFNELSAISGVGKFKVLRCRDNKGEVNPEWVTIVFTDSNFGVPSEELVEQVQEYFQPLDPETKLPTVETSGIGLASIGQLCWVEGVKEEKIDFSLNLTFENDYSWDNLEEVVKEKIKERLIQYAAEDWGDTVVTTKSYTPINHYITIRRAEIESLLIGIEGIQDSTAIRINGEFDNYNLAWNAIPALGNVTLHSAIESETPQGNCPYNCPDCQYNRDPEQCGRL